MRTAAPLRDMVRSHTAARLKKLDSELTHVAREPKDPGAIHDLRVSIRRLSRELQVFEEWFHPAQIKRIRGRLRKLMEHCAAVRNCDVAIEVLRAAGCRSPKLEAGLEEERRRMREVLTRKLASWQRRDRVREWRGHLRAAKHASNAELGATSQEKARRLLPPMMEDLFRAGREAARPAASHQTMHQFRLKTKRLRYTLELFEPVYGGKTKQMMESLKGLQEKLGAINDCATTLEMIRRDRGAALAVRRLAREREAEFRNHWKKHFGPPHRTQWKAVLRAADGKI
jgi:CHAD domain-containing protein